MYPTHAGMIPPVDALLPEPPVPQEPPRKRKKPAKRAAQEKASPQVHFDPIPQANSPFPPHPQQPMGDDPMTSTTAFRTAMQSLPPRSMSGPDPTGHGHPNDPYPRWNHSMVAPSPQSLAQIQVQHSIAVPHMHTHWAPSAPPSSQAYQPHPPQGAQTFAYTPPYSQDGPSTWVGDAYYNHPNQAPVSIRLAVTVSIALT
jgi:hypothetical protein